MMDRRTVLCGDIEPAGTRLPDQGDYLYQELRPDGGDDSYSGIICGGL